jgi:hypothetical protein
LALGAVKKACESARAGVSRKVPVPGQAVNDGRSRRLSDIAGGFGSRAAPPPGDRHRPGPVEGCHAGIFDRDSVKIPTNRSLFSVYRRGAARFMMARAAYAFEKATTPADWLAPMDTSHLAEHAGTAGTLFASIFVVSMTTMKTMVPLRVFGILLNLVLIGTAIPTHNYLTIMVQSVVLVLNAYRLHQMLQLIRDVRKSVNGDLSIDWLRPFMTERNCKAGEIIYYKDEKAEDMAYIVSGRFRLVESGIELPVGAIVGELGMLAPSKVRTQTVECIADGLILSVSYTKVEELYVQNPEFGFYFLRLSSARLFQNIEKLEQRLAQQIAMAKPA